MTAFSVDWLSLREPFDREARRAGLGLDGLAARLCGDCGPLTVLDLACGTGANLRSLAPRLGGAQRWTLIDHDARLLAALPGEFEAWARALGLSMHASRNGFHLERHGLSLEVELLQADLARPLDTALLARHRLITASALLDLVSAQWIDSLAAQARGARAAMLFALSVDGSAEWQPELPDDDTVHQLFVAHQGRDKGFGPALGASAARIAEERLAALGYEVTRASSDWRIDGRDGMRSTAMLHAMVEGAASAALEQDPAASAQVARWSAGRIEVIQQTSLRVGHVDLLATLP